MVQNKKIAVDDSVAVLKGVGQKTLENLHDKFLVRLHDLLFYLPYRYEDRTRLASSAELISGHYVFFQGEIISTQVQFGRRRSLLCKLMLDSKVLGLRFYFFSKTQQANLKAGRIVRVYGLLADGASGLEIYHPEYSFVEGDLLPLDKSLTPVYPAINNISQKKLRKWVRECFEKIDPVSLQDIFSGTHSFEFDLFECLKCLHFPPSGEDLNSFLDGSNKYLQRLIKEELAAHYLSRSLVKEKNKQYGAVAIHANVVDNFISSLPFSLTHAQKNVADDIVGDLSRNVPMLRLLQGDVGSGKTVVAAIAAMQVVNQGMQVAIMAPTEILAEQHYKTFTAWFANFDAEVGLLTSSVTAKRRQALLKQLVENHISILVGTHAIFQDDVVYQSLTLIIIDEQHRFGVHQRLALQSKMNGDLKPHQLVMTATPIPRTLAMTLYADMDVSVIDELPAGRQPIETVLMSEDKQEALIRRLMHVCEQGQQVYWVCTLIETSDTLDSQAAEEVLRVLQQALPGLNIAILHGRMKSADKNKTMQAFIDKQIHILVATTVIEVGVDVPNASIIVIQNPERLGLAQLHQLRGRVGRGSEKSYCVLLYGEKLSRLAKERLNVIKQNTDGFVIAEEDLRIRGAGEFLGARQSGELSMRVADVYRDAYLLDEVKMLSENLKARFPDRVPQLIERWLPNAQSYAEI